MSGSLRRRHGYQKPSLFGTRLRTPALKTESLSKKLGRFSATPKRIYENALLLFF